MSKSSKSSGSRSSSKLSASTRSRSKASISIEMFPLQCNPSFVNRTRKIEFQKLSEKLGLPIGDEDSDNDDEWYYFTKGRLCENINDHAILKGKKATKKQKKTKRKHKIPAPKKAAHKS